MFQTSKIKLLNHETFTNLLKCNGIDLINVC